MHFNCHLFLVFFFPRGEAGVWVGGEGAGGWWWGWGWGVGGGECAGYSRNHLSMLPQSFFLSPGYLSVLAYLLSSRSWLRYFSILAQSSLSHGSFTSQSLLSHLLVWLSHVLVWLSHQSSSVSPGLHTHTHAHTHTHTHTHTHPHTHIHTYAGTHDPHTHARPNAHARTTTRTHTLPPPTPPEISNI